MLPTTDTPVLTTEVSKAPTASGTSAKPRFDDIFMDLAVNLAKRSHCIKAQVGAVLTRDTRIISIGYNGPPAGTHNCDEEFPGVGCPRDSKGSCSLALHAEQNAILYAAKNGSEIEGSTIYVTLSPCIACARIIYSMKIARVVFLNSYAEYKGIPSDEGVDFLRRFGVTVERYVTSSGVNIGADLPITEPMP
ncbi:deoxycytidylate deaminase [Spirosoma pulveris]